VPRWPIREMDAAPAGRPVTVTSRSQLTEAGGLGRAMEAAVGGDLNSRSSTPPACGHVGFGVFAPSKLEAKPWCRRGPL